MGWLVVMWHVERWKRKHTLALHLPLCSVSPSPAAEQRWEMQQWEMPMDQHGHPVRKIYTMSLVSSGTKFWKGFDSEMSNHFQVKENVSLMLSHPRVKFLAWLSMAPHSDTTE